MLSVHNGCAAAVLAAALIAGGCGSSSHSSTSASAGATTSASSSATGKTTTAATPAGGPGALSGEAQAAATGDIPDNQVFLVFHNRAGYSIKYPEGWTQEGHSANVTFKDKNNLVHIVVSRGTPPSVASVAAQLIALKRMTPSLTFTAPRPIRVGASRAIKVKYTTKSAPNPVTGKRVTLTVDRYELARSRRLAVVDLGTPVGVDNVDAYRMMIQSFTWR